MSPAPSPLPGLRRAACAWDWEPCSLDAEALSRWGQRPRRIQGRGRAAARPAPSTHTRQLTGDPQGGVLPLCRGQPWVNAILRRPLSKSIFTLLFAPLVALSPSNSHACSLASLHALLHDALLLKTEPACPASSPPPNTWLASPAFASSSKRLGLARRWPWRPSTPTRTIFFWDRAFPCFFWASLRTNGPSGLLIWTIAARSARFFLSRTGQACPSSPRPIWPWRWRSSSGSWRGGPPFSPGGWWGKRPSRRAWRSSPRSAPSFLWGDGGRGFGKWTGRRRSGRPG